MLVLLEPPPVPPRFPLLSLLLLLLLALSRAAARSLTVFPGANVGEGVAAKEAEEADAGAEEEEAAEKEDPAGEPGGGGDPPPSPPPPPPAAVNSSSAEERELLRGDWAWAKEVGKNGKTGDAFAGLKLPKEPPVQSPLPEAPADAAAKMKGESAMREVGEPGPSVLVVAAAAAAAEAMELEEEVDGEEAKVNLLGAPGAKLGRLAPALLLLPLLLLLPPRLLLPLLAPLLALVIVVGAIWNG